jgi:hypothetical protein
VAILPSFDPQIAIEQADRLMPSLKQLGYSVSPSPTTVTASASASPATVPMKKKRK